MVGVSHLEAGQLLRGHLAKVIAQAQLPRVPAAPEVEVPVLGNRAGVIFSTDYAGSGHVAQCLDWREALACLPGTCAQLSKAIVACTAMAAFTHSENSPQRQQHSWPLTMAAGVQLTRSRCAALHELDRVRAQNGLQEGSHLQQPA